MGKTTRPFRYDLNEIPYDYTVELKNRFKGLWTEVRDIIQGTGIRTIPMEKKCKKAKWLSEEALQIAVKRREVKWSCSVESGSCNPVDCSLPGFSIHGILQAGIMEWVTISFSRGSSQPRDWTRVSRIGGRRFNLWATREAFCFPELLQRGY